jgi:hypothetical protein
MIKVKVTHPYGNWPLARQTPNDSGIWENCQFFINDDTQECDYWFVFDDLLKEESVTCNPKNVTIITLEFPEIRPNINLDFLKQFFTVLTYSRVIKHPRVIDILAPFPWHIGVNNTNDATTTIGYKIYNDFKVQPIPEKTKLISVISSNKQYIEGHRQRLGFVNALKDYFGESIDIFGRGINNFADKWDIISPYKYHISLENSSCNNGISEKLYDSFLGEAFPFYYGCKNICDYFPAQSFVSIDINQVDKSLKIIESSIVNEVYEKNIHYIQQSKNLVIDKYNLFNLMASHCINNSQNQKAAKLNYFIKLKPERCFNTKLARVKRFLSKSILSMPFV